MLMGHFMETNFHLRNHIGAHHVPGECVAHRRSVHMECAGLGGVDAIAGDTIVTTMAIIRNRTQARNPARQPSESK